MRLALLKLRIWLLDRGDRGASVIEYALLVALIATVCVVAVSVLGVIVNDEIRSSADQIP
jgi:Flp pilus assembly pilin Flp